MVVKETPAGGKCSLSLFARQSLFFAPRYSPSTFASSTGCSKGGWAGPSSHLSGLYTRPLCWNQSGVRRREPDSLPDLDSALRRPVSAMSACTAETAAPLQHRVEGPALVCAPIALKIRGGCAPYALAAFWTPSGGADADWKSYTTRQLVDDLARTEWSWNALAAPVNASLDFHVTDATGRSVVSEAPMRVLSNGRDDDGGDTWCLRSLKNADPGAAAGAASNDAYSPVAELPLRTVNTVTAGTPVFSISSSSSLSLPSPSLSAGPDGQVQTDPASAFRDARQPHKDKVIESVLASLLALSLVVVLVLAFLYASLRKRYSDARLQLVQLSPRADADTEAEFVAEKVHPARQMSQKQSQWGEPRFPAPPVDVGIGAVAVGDVSQSRNWRPLGARTERNHRDSTNSTASASSASSAYSADARSLTSNPHTAVLPAPASDAMTQSPMLLSPDQPEQQSSARLYLEAGTEKPSASAVTAVSTEWYHARAARTVPLRSFSLCNSDRSPLASVGALTETKQMGGEGPGLAVDSDQDGTLGKGDWARRFLSRRT